MSPLENIRRDTVKSVVMLAYLVLGATRGSKSLADFGFKGLCIWHVQDLA